MQCCGKTHKDIKDGMRDHYFFVDINLYEFNTCNVMWILNKYPQIIAALHFTADI